MTETIGIKLIRYTRDGHKQEIYEVISHSDDWKTDRLMYIKLLQELGEKLIEKRKETKG